MGATPLSQLETATSIPNGSLHMVEMGDGSGTKTVTQEILTKEVGEGLKIGDLEDLGTENKTSIVDAINEAAQSGGGGAAVDILDTKEEIEANTEAGKAAGAQAVKEMFGEINSNLTADDGSVFRFGVTPNGKPGWKDGADSVHPFSDGNESVNIAKYFSCMVDSGSLQSNYSTGTSYAITEVGKYTVICVCNAYSNGGYSVYHNATKILTVPANINAGITAAIYKIAEVECNAGDTISLKDFNGNSHNMMTHTLVLH